MEVAKPMQSVEGTNKACSTFTMNQLPRIDCMVPEKQAHCVSLLRSMLARRR